MKVFTTRFGEIDIDDKEIVTFPEGILGFEELKRYIIFKMEDDNPLMWMQALDEAALAFVIIQPLIFNPNYALEISDKDADQLYLKQPEDADIFSIVVIPDDPSQMTANLQGPIVINRKLKIGKQVISTNPKHKIKHYILKEMEKNFKNNGEDK